jgi:hypothetical protein
MYAVDSVEADDCGRPLGNREEIVGFLRVVATTGWLSFAHAFVFPQALEWSVDHLLVQFLSVKVKQNGEGLVECLSLSAAELEHLAGDGAVQDELAK